MNELDRNTKAGLLFSKFTKRRFLSSMGAVAALFGAWPMRTFATDSDQWDVIIVGGGTAGLPAALFSVMRGSRVLIIDAAPALGGTLFMSGGLMSAAGTKLQKAHGIKDTPQSHFEDINALSGGTADPEIVRLAVFNAAETFDWLTDHGLEVPEEFPSFGPPHHDPYSAARYASGRNQGMSILRVFQEQLKPYIDDGRIHVALNTEVKALIQDGRGRVIGVETLGKIEGDVVDSRRFMGRNIALTSGGYASNPAMWKELQGVTDYAHNSYPYSQGAGIKLGLQVGGYHRGGWKYVPMFGSVLKDDNYPSLPAGRILTVPTGRLPWEIYVNSQGVRFVQEDSEAFSTYERALAVQPEQKFWAVFDETILRDAPPILSGEWTASSIRDAFDNGTPHFYKASSIEELAELAGIRSEGLSRTVARYNEAVKKGGTDTFGRTHMPHPITKPPFYAIVSHGTSLISFAGLAVDNSLRVLRRGDVPIEGLFAAGEVLGAGQLMGRAYCGGMTVTPSVTFGRLLGQRFFDL